MANYRRLINYNCVLFELFIMPTSIIMALYFDKLYEYDSNHYSRLSLTIAPCGILPFLFDVWAIMNDNRGKVDFAMSIYRRRPLLNFIAFNTLISIIMVALKRIIGEKYFLK